MKKALAVILTLFFSAVLISQESELEKYKRMQREEINQWKQERDAELDAYKARVEKERKEWKEYVNSVRSIWGEFSDTTPKVWSDYGNNLKTLSVVDFENNKVELAAVIEEGSKESAEKLIELQFEKLLNEREKGSGKKFMEGQIAFDKKNEQAEKRVLELQKKYDEENSLLAKKAEQDRIAHEKKKMEIAEKAEKDRQAYEIKRKEAEKKKAEEILAFEKKKEEAATREAEERKAFDLKKKELEKLEADKREAELRKKAEDEQKRLLVEKAEIEKKQIEEQNRIQAQKEEIERKQKEEQRKLEEEKARIEKKNNEEKKKLAEEKAKEEKKAVKTVDASNGKDFIKEEVTKNVKKETVKGEDGKVRTKYTVTLEMAPNALKNRAELYLDMIKTHSEKYNIDPALVLALIHTESAFNPKAFSRRPDGTPMACGLMQIIPSQAGRDAHKALYGKDKIVESEYLFDPENNLKMGTWYVDFLGKWWRRYEEKNLKKTSSTIKNEYYAISSYNQGMGTILNKAYKKHNLIEKSEEETYKILTTENEIPHEGRDYLKKVTERKKIYEKN
jgi:membrane-bound lytic murein transglycosylase C